MARLPYIEIQQARHSLIVTALPVKLLTYISYAAVRHVDQEEGAVQRVLNHSRIAGIRAFALQDGDFPTSIVLNAVGGRLERDRVCIEIPEVVRSAQIIDGQHRVAGLREAMNERPEYGNYMVPITIYESLTTQECANIFLSINTEQRPAPRSLVYDLYGISSPDLVDQAAVRARDIALSLGEDDQAYAGLIKLPNSRRQKGGIALSTAVSSIKPLVAEKGILEQIGADSLEIQTQIFCNFFNAISDKYGDLWLEKDNAFLYAAGFVGAVEFLQSRIIPYCTTKKSFKKELIASTLHFDQSDLIKQEEVKGLGGKDAPRKIFDRLNKFFVPEKIDSTSFEL